VTILIKYIFHSLCIPIIFHHVFLCAFLFSSLIIRLSIFSLFLSLSLSLRDGESNATSIFVTDVTLLLRLSHGLHSDVPARRPLKPLDEGKER
jgi:hypothetical protein